MAHSRVEDLIVYKSEFGLWWPRYDRGPEKAFELISRSLKDSDHAMYLCRHRRVAVQAGGHVGLWPIRLRKFFNRVVTFEPQVAMYECIVRNAAKANVVVEAHCAALGAAMSDVLMLKGKHPTTWRVDRQGDVVVPMVTIDSLALPHCDAIFLDIEGYEVEALRGARETIERCSPVIQCEMLPRARAGIGTHLSAMGYRFDRAVGKDGIYVRRR